VTTTLEPDSRSVNHTAAQPSGPRARAQLMSRFGSGVQAKQTVNILEIGDDLFE
jgi:hypothetical protein